MFILFVYLFYLFIYLFFISDFFAEKMREAFAQQKLLSFFSAKKGGNVLACNMIEKLTSR